MSHKPSRYFLILSLIAWPMLASAGLPQAATTTPAPAAAPATPPAKPPVQKIIIIKQPKPAPAKPGATPQRLQRHLRSLQLRLWQLLPLRRPRNLQPRLRARRQQSRAFCPHFSGRRPAQVPPVAARAVHQGVVRRVRENLLVLARRERPAFFRVFSERGPRVPEQPAGKPRGPVRPQGARVLRQRGILWFRLRAAAAAAVAQERQHQILRRGAT